MYRISCLHQQCTCQLYLNLSDIRIIQKNKLTKFMVSMYQAFYFLLCKQYAFCVVSDKAFHVKSLGTNLIRGTLLLSALLQRDWASQTFLVMVVFSKCILRGLSILKFQVGHSKQIIKAKIIKMQNTLTVVMFSEQAINRWSCFGLGDRCRLVSSHHIFAAIIWLLKQFFGSYNGIWHISRLFCQITVQFREGHKT